MAGLKFEITQGGRLLPTIPRVPRDGIPLVPQLDLRDGVFKQSTALPNKLMNGRLSIYSGIPTILKIVPYHFADSYNVSIIGTSQNPINVRLDRQDDLIYLFHDTDYPDDIELDLLVNGTVIPLLFVGVSPSVPQLLGDPLIEIDRLGWVSITEFENGDLFADGKSEWQIATDAAFTNIVLQKVVTTADAYLAKLDLAGVLPIGDYFIRARYIGTL